MTEFADDELPLPSFVEVFGDGHPDMILVANNAAAARRRLANKRSGSRLGAGDESSGRWTPEEQKLSLEGLMLYGKDWKKMAPLIKTRTLVQIRTHAQKVFKKMGLKMLDKGKQVGQKRGLEDEDDFDEEKLYLLKQSGQLEGMIASGELNVGEGDDADRPRIAMGGLGGLGAAPSPLHPNAHLAPQASGVRLPAVGLQGPPPALPADDAPNDATGHSPPPPGATQNPSAQPQAGGQQSTSQQQGQHSPHPHGQGAVAPTQGQGQGPPYMLGAGGVGVQPPYHSLQMIQQQAAMQQQVTLQQQQQEYMRQQQQFMLHQKMQQEEFQRQLAYQQQQQQQQGYHQHPPPH